MPHQCTACGHVFEDGSKEMLSGCPDCGGNKFQFRPAGETTSDSSASEALTEAPSDDSDSSGSSDTPDTPEPSVGDGSSVAETVGRATTKVRDFVSSTPEPPLNDPNPEAEWPGEWEGPSKTSHGEGTPKRSHGDTDPTPNDGDESLGEDGEIIDADARRRARSEPGEDTAQASARTDVVSPSELDTGSLSSSPPAADANENADQPPTAPDTPSNGEVVGEPTGEEPDLTELREQLNDQFESIKILEPGQYELNLMELYDREEYIIALQENGRYVIQVPEQWIGEDLDDR